MKKGVLNMYWIHPDLPDASQSFSHCLASMLRQYNKNNQPLVFVCIGTPSILGDCLGPVIGSILTDALPEALPAITSPASIASRPDTTLQADTAAPADTPSIAHLPSADIYGTLDAPVHALNFRHICHEIEKQHQKPFIIAIDAALGNSAQSGYILLKKGPLHPGKGVGKKLPPIGDVQITGIFQDIFDPMAGHQMARFSRCISQGILEFYPSLQRPQ